MTIPTPATVVTCFLCGHTETGESYHPHDAMTEHYRTHTRPKGCGCVYRQRGWEAQSGIDVCDDHAPAYLRERTEWRLANHHARRWATPEPEQGSLFERTTHV